MEGSSNKFKQPSTTVPLSQLPIPEIFSKTSFNLSDLYRSLSGVMLKLMCIFTLRHTANGEARV